jgi:hypothetical protein
MTEIETMSTDEIKTHLKLRCDEKLRQRIKVIKNAANQNKIVSVSLPRKEGSVTLYLIRIKDE